MPNVTRRSEQLQLRKAELERILALRRGKPGFAANATAIEAEIATIAEEISSGSDGALQDDNP